MEIKLLEGPMGLDSALMGLGLNFFLTSGYERWVDVPAEEQERIKKVACRLAPKGGSEAKWTRAVYYTWSIRAPRFWWQEMDTYRVGTDRLSSESTMHIQGKGLTEEELVKMKEELTEGTMQKRVQVFSYQALRRIYFQRRNHRLPHWKEFCKWIETLPFAAELITIEKD